MGRPLTATTGRSLWSDTAPAAPDRPPLAGDATVDVAIVGGGLTGLWTAHYLAEADPSLRIAVLEAETVGYGASGRNGGWCSALFPASLDSLAALGGRAAALAQHAAMRDSVREVVETADRLGVDAQAARGGTITLVRSPAQLRRAEAELAHARGWGVGEDELRLLDAGAARARLDATRTLAATYTPDCAALHPLRLVRGLADSLTGRGVVVHEHTRATAIAPGTVTTAAGTVTAGTVVRATEGYTPGLPGHQRDVIPVYSLVIATEPLPAATWERIGLRERETFTDHRHLIIYGQRTADDRLVFGGRGAPYHFGSRVSPAFDRDERVFAGLRATLVEMFPVLADVGISHAWGGPLGIARDWCASVGLDRHTRVAWAGGYVGDGVSTTNLAGRTLRDLVLDRDTELTRLPWVGHQSPRWEPEPLRWLGVNAGLRAMTWADAEERVTGRPSLVARAVAPLLG
ncbi:FAD-dependent oxidoreductase [Nocardioides aestuarii]|uniref:NAD(P)/FAD-dependent oxidoreductase n=1 Tax=Nocardioides aestuarii TaxID=252231 RepID=A0ABW4TI03_9ACTN